MSRYLSVGIDIGSAATRVVIVEASKNDSGFKIKGTGSARSQGVRLGYVVNQGEATKGLKEALAAAQKRAGVRVGRALLSVGGISLESAVSSGSVLIPRADGEVTEDDVERAIGAGEDSLHLTNKKIIHRFPLMFKLDNKEVLGRPQGMRGMKLEVKTLFVTVLEQHLEDIISTVEQAGVQVEDVVASPIAESLATLTKTQRTAGCLLANIGAETVSIAVFENDQIISLQTFPIGGTKLTNDIALGLKIPLEDAENIKVSGSESKTHSQKKIDDIIDARLKDIFELIEAHLKKLGRSELLPAGIVITGGGAGTSTVEEVAKASLKLPSKIAIPHSFSTSGGGVLDPSWAVAYGLCILGFDEEYQSDLIGRGAVSVKGGLRSVLDWLKQFSV